MAVVNGNIGSAYQNLKQSAKAIPYIAKAIQQQIALGDKARVALNLNNIAAAYNDLHQYKKAYKASLEGIKYAREADDKESLGYAYLTAGTAAAGLQNYKQALVFMDTVQRFAMEMDMVPLKLSYYQQAGNVYKAVGNYKRSLELSEIMGALKDSTYNAEKHEQIAALQEQYESQKKDKQLAQNALADAKNKDLLTRNHRVVIGLIVSILILITIATLVVRNMRLKGEKLKSEKALAAFEAEQDLLNEKLRISGELHDNIGSQLTFIHSSIQNMRGMPDGAQQSGLKETEEIAVNTIRDLRQTVWFINNSSFTPDDFAIRLREYIKPYQLLGSTEIIINNHIPETVSISSAKATHLFRIVQEAINNALKYANAGTIEVKLEAHRSGNITVTIHDDGHGFDTQLSSAGFGLRNMEARAQKAGGVVEITSAVGKGTTVKVNVPG
ncbi:tetratricopeptide repeat-containing sensor histidine kinase [Mucilaginibacter antarcticus]|uniref:tetratricopeptide repeat-containing sensor histidine kinase n=1 Tax=Mucilaginibacter antarcticus TaxID=1855725 RepID=UPI0036339EF2